MLVTRPAEAAGELAALLTAAGCEPVVAPTVAIQPVEDVTGLDRALREIGAYRWVILTSANAAVVFAQRAAALRVDRDALAKTTLVTGRAGAAMLEAVGMKVGRVVSPFSAAAVLKALEAEAVAGQRVLLPRAEGGREELAAGLRGRGAVVEEVSVYRTVPVRESDEVVGALRVGVAAVTLFSPSAVRGLTAALRSGGISVERALDGVLVACLGATTAGEARARGLRVDVVPSDTTAAALAEALVEALAAAKGANREVVWSA